MQPTAFGHQIQTLHEGLTVFQGGAGRFIPMQATEVDIQVTAGVAIIRTQRTFRNNENVAIEAVLTMPVGFDTVVTGLSATVDDRKLVAVAKPQSTARDDYEVAIDKGKMAILHEEVLKGVHTLSVAQLAPGKEVMIELETVTAMGCIAGDPFLRIPTNVGQIYGTSPLMPADDLITGSQAHYTAKLSAICDQGIATLDDGRIISQGEPVEVILNKAIELRVVGGCFGKVSGQSAKGQVVELELKPIKTADTFLDIAVLVDRSGSTVRPVGHNGATIWSTMRDGLSSAFSGLQNGDQISLWQFDNSCEKLGVANGSASARLVNKLDEPAGGTDLAEAVTQLLNDGVHDILVLTDGQTWAHDVDGLKSKNARISAILVGDNSLDANIGHLCAMTGGQVFYAPGDNVAAAISTGLTAMRSGTGRGLVKLSGTLPKKVTVNRAGVEVAISWLENSTDAGGDAIGRYAASLAIPFLPLVVAKGFAESHSLCSHMTSLVLVDEAGDVMDMLPEMRKVPLMESQVRKSLLESHVRELRKSLLDSQVRKSLSYSSIISSIESEPRLACDKSPIAVSASIEALKMKRENSSKESKDKTKKFLHGGPKDETEESGNGTHFLLLIPILFVTWIVLFIISGDAGLWIWFYPVVACAVSWWWLVIHKNGPFNSDN